MRSLSVNVRSACRKDEKFYFRFESKVSRMHASSLTKMKKNHGTQDSRVVPHRGTNWAALRLTTQIERDAVLSESYGRGY